MLCAARPGAMRAPQAQTRRAAPAGDPSIVLHGQINTWRRRVSARPETLQARASMEAEVRVTAISDRTT